MYKRVVVVVVKRVVVAKRVVVVKRMVVVKRVVFTFDSQAVSCLVRAH